MWRLFLPLKNPPMALQDKYIKPTSFFLTQLSLPSPLTFLTPASLKERERHKRSTFFTTKLTQDMKKMLVLMALLGGLAAVSPVMAQRGNRVEPTENRNDRRGDGDHEGRHYENGNRHGRPNAAGVHDNRYGDKHRKGVHGKKHGHCRKGAPARGPRRGGRD